MKKAHISIALMCAALLLFACSQGPTDSYTITGYLLDMREESTQVPEQSALKTNTAPTTDISNVKVSIRHQALSEDDNKQPVVLASRKFDNGTVKFQGRIDKLTEIEVFLDFGDEKTLATSALIGPGKDVSFALIDVVDPLPDRLVLYSESRRAKNSASKFTIAGKLDSIIDDGAFAIAEVTTESWNEKGETISMSLGSVLLVDRSFTIEAEIDEPTVVDIHVDLLGDQTDHISGVAVVEPGNTINVTSRGLSADLIATSTSHLHSVLVETWQENEEYQSKMLRGQTLQQEFMAEWQELQALASNSSEDVTSGVPSEDSPDDGKVSSESDASLDLPLAEECEHVSLTDVRPSIEESFEPPEFRVVWDEAWQIRVDTLEETALNSEDPWIILLALELGAFNFYFGDLDHALRVHDELFHKLDNDVAERRLKPRRDLLANYLQMDKIDKSLVPGQKAPTFILADLQGVDIKLQDVLDANDLVYIDFWASWCGPCIATFPHLKSLYATHEEDGFEIIVISIDETFDEWEIASQEQDLPWLSVADLGGFERETPLAYGVRFIPKAYLLDSTGCILQKDLTTDTLEEVLSMRYDEKSMPKATESSEMED